MKRQEAIEGLLSYSKKSLSELTQLIEQQEDKKKVSTELQIKVYLLLNSLRPILDYIATEIAEKLKIQKKYTPNFPFLKSKKEFDASVERKFPKLKEIYPDIHTYIENLQLFSSQKNIWLKDFIELTNHNKHNTLSEQTILTKNLMKIGNLTIIGGKFNASKGTKINGKIVKQSFELDSASPISIEFNEYLGLIERNKYEEILFKDTNVSVLNFINTVIKNIELIYKDMEKLI